MFRPLRGVRARSQPYFIRRDTEFGCHFFFRFLQKIKVFNQLNLQRNKLLLLLHLLVKVFPPARAWRTRHRRSSTKMYINYKSLRWTTTPHLNTVDGHAFILFVPNESSGYEPATSSGRCCCEEEFHRQNLHNLQEIKPPLVGMRILSFVTEPSTHRVLCRYSMQIKKCWSLERLS